MGTICSFFLGIVLIVYTGYKVSILEAKKSVEILQAVNKNYFNDFHSFGASQGLNFAVSVFDQFDVSTFNHIDPRYGKLQFLKASYGIGADGNFRTAT